MYSAVSSVSSLHGSRLLVSCPTNDREAPKSGVRVSFTLVAQHSAHGLGYNKCLKTVR